MADDILGPEIVSIPNKEVVIVAKILYEISSRHFRNTRIKIKIVTKLNLSLGSIDFWYV